MNRGFKKVAEKLPEFADKDIGFILKNTGMTLLSNIGGASGPLFGTFFIRAAKPTASLQSCLLYTSPSPRDRQKSRMPSSA